MSKAILVVGESGSGKSTSIRTLPPEQSFIINIGSKDLPFKGANKQYKAITKDNPKGNLINASDTNTIIQTMAHISKDRPDIKYIVLDDSQYSSAFNYIARIEENGWKKFNDATVNIFTVAQLAKSLRDDIKVFILNHDDVDYDVLGNVVKIKAKTLGKATEKYIKYEGLFTIVLFTKVSIENGAPSFKFMTQTNGLTTAKTPMGMFEESEIDNDLKLVADKVDEYYS